MTQFNQEIIGTTAAIFILAGILNCFVGYRIFKIILGIWGFILGFILATALVSWLGIENQGVELIAGVVGGIIGVFIMIKLFQVGIFIIGAIFGYTLGALLIAAAGYQPDTVLLALAAILGGIIALLLQRPMIILSTAFSGAWLVILGVAHLAGTPFDLIKVLQQPDLLRHADVQFYIMFFLWILLSIVGAGVQFKVTGKKPNK